MDIWDREDSFRFGYRELDGDGTVTTRVLTQQDTDPWALAGVMVRSSLDSTSSTAIMARTPGHGLSWTYRSEAGTSARYEGTTGVTGLPVWVRITRSGSTVTGSYSLDGSTWVTGGTATIAMPQKVYIGLAVTSHDNTRLGAATFDNLTVAAGTVTPAPSASAGAKPVRPARASRPGSFPRLGIGCSRSSTC